MGWGVSEIDEGSARAPWTDQENQLVVADYFAMMAEDLAGRSFNKAATLRALAPLLNSRSRGSIEFKRANISAALDELGFRHLTGYLPRGNFQRSLLDAVVAELQRTGLLGPLVASAEKAPATDTEELSPASDFVDPPTPLSRERVKMREATPYIPRITNYSERDADNRELGIEGERWVVEFEQRRLARLGREDLSRRVEWTAHERGDGFGFDITSFDPDGVELLVEVKTTRMGKRWPFIVTRNELRVSQKEHERYRVYRVFRFGRDPEVYRLSGAIDDSCELEPIRYQAQVC